jgi:copper homeostasis protein
MVKPLLEIACFSPQALLQAAGSAADRLEYCAHYAHGGISPPVQGFDLLRKKATQPIFVMIRCRAGDFVYSNAEVKRMQQQIRDFQSAGADGFVFGTLLPHDRLDQFALEKLAQAADEHPWTFHRAFDQLQEPEKALQTLLEAGCSNLLTSGCPTTALHGIPQLRQYSTLAGANMRILAGGGLRSHNLAQLLAENIDLDYHSAALLPGTELPDLNEISRLKQLLEQHQNSF